MTLNKLILHIFIMTFFLLNQYENFSAVLSLIWKKMILASYELMLMVSNK